MKWNGNFNAYLFITCYPVDEGKVGTTPVMTTTRVAFNCTRVLNAHMQLPIWRWWAARDNAPALWACRHFQHNFTVEYAVPYRGKSNWFDILHR